MAKRKLTELKDELERKNKAEMKQRHLNEVNIHLDLDFF
jgi:hypothetical protein